MAKINLYNMQGSVVGEIELSDSVFAIEPNEAAVHQVVKGQLANLRQGTSKTKGRSEVRGGGRKPYRQKGTGRARQGSIRAAQWVGGGVIFGPLPRDYRQKLPKKLRRLALKSVLSDKLASENLVVVDSLSVEKVSTKAFAGVIKALGLAETKTLLVQGSSNEAVFLSGRNLKGLSFGRVDALSTLSVLKADKLLLTKEAAEKIQEVYA